MFYKTGGLEYYGAKTIDPKAMGSTGNMTGRNNVISDKGLVRTHRRTHSDIDTQKLNAFAFSK